MRTFTREGLVFDVDDTGPAGADVALLLHGWPQDRSAWHRVTPLLAAAGLRVVAPDQRGYSPGARPTGRAAYRLPELVADVRAAVEATGADAVHLVGHDWGGAVAWAFAERHPDLLRTLTVLSTPHHRAFAAALRRPDQAVRSGYMAFFQLPVLPEVLLRATLPRLLRSSGLPEEQVGPYVDRFRSPGAAAGELAWYRALPWGASILSGIRIPLGRKDADADSTPPRRIPVPTTYVWGRHDPALGRAAAQATAEWVAADYRFVELDAGHWLPETNADEVAAAVLSRAGGAR